ncbi:MAG: hypothetical protein LBJ64_00945, partial [Deltaproteobacteria bacterium]|nr:hypothetical protein [Deltaproteobacteria bacterium]
KTGEAGLSAAQDGEPERVDLVGSLTDEPIPADLANLAQASPALDRQAELFAAKALGDADRGK